MDKQEEIACLNGEIDKLRTEIEDIRRKLELLSKTVAEMKEKEAEEQLLLRGGL